MSGLRRVRVCGTGRAPKRAPKRISLSAYAFTPDMRIGDWFRVVRIQGDATETSVTLAALPVPATPAEPGLREAEDWRARIERSRATWLAIEPGDPLRRTALIRVEAYNDLLGRAFGDRTP